MQTVTFASKVSGEVRSTENINILPNTKTNVGPSSNLIDSKILELDATTNNIV